MKYEPIEFSKLSEAVAYVEDGGELYQLDAGHAYEVSESTLFGCWRDRLFTKANPAPWYEKLDSTVDSGVLCWISDDEEFSSTAGHSSINLIYGYRDFGDYRFESYSDYYAHAKPLTRTEIQRFMDNAPEES